MTELSRTNLFRIPVLAVLPLALVGCPDDETTDDDSNGTDTGNGSDTGTNPGRDTGGSTDDDAGGGDDASGGDDDASGGDDDASGGDDDAVTEPDSGEPVTPGDLAGFLEDTAESNAVYCAQAVECGLYDDAAACVAARQAEAETYFGEFTQECLDAIAAFSNCYNAGTLSCEDDPEYGPYVGSDADCEEEYATSYATCFGGE